LKLAKSIYEPGGSEGLTENKEATEQGRNYNQWEIEYRSNVENGETTKSKLRAQSLMKRNK